jgi:hypothetical protein
MKKMKEAKEFLLALKYSSNSFSPEPISIDDSSSFKLNAEELLKLSTDQKILFAEIDTFAKEYHIFQQLIVQKVRCRIIVNFNPRESKENLKN